MNDILFLALRIEKQTTRKEWFMKINLRVPSHQKQVLDYMLRIEPVARTLRDLVLAIELLAVGGKYQKLPERIRANKGFDGLHSESKYILEIIKVSKILQMNVQQSYIAQEQGNRRKIVARHLDLSEAFLVDFKSNKIQSNGRSSWRQKFSITIFRNGTIHSGVSYTF